METERKKEVGREFVKKDAKREGDKRNENEKSGKKFAGK